MTSSKPVRKKTGSERSGAYHGAAAIVAEVAVLGGAVDHADVRTHHRGAHFGDVALAGGATIGVLLRGGIRHCAGAAGRAKRWIRVIEGGAHLVAQCAGGGADVCGARDGAGGDLPLAAEALVNARADAGGGLAVGAQDGRDGRGGAALSAVCRCEK